MSAALSFRSLTKRFGRVAALDDVTFDVPQGSLFGLLGPNGAGKTTLFSIAAGFLHPTSGDAEALGIHAGRIGLLRGRFSMLPQDAAFQGGIPVLEQLVMFCRLGGMDSPTARTASREALEKVGLGEVAGRAARTLSHGMMKRAQLCQAFLGDPELVLLDEPTSGLDPENARNVRELIRGMRGSKTVVLSSHNLHEVQDLCDHVAILHKGRLVESGATASLTAAATLLRFTFAVPPTAAALDALRRLSYVSAVVPQGGDGIEVRLALPSPDAHESALRALLETLLVQGAVPRSMSEGASLETRFLEITGGSYDAGGAT